LDEALQILEDMKKSGHVPDVVTFNSLMKVQLSAGRKQVEQSFNTFNEMSETVNPNLSSFGLLLRACSMIENVSLGEEIYSFAIYKFLHSNPAPENQLTINFYNCMLDVYAEGRNDRILPFFEQMVQKKISVNGLSFNSLAKALIFMDQRHKLVYLPEMMRVEGVLQKELGRPIRSEIFEAMKQHSHYYKADDLKTPSMNREIEERFKVFSQFTNSSHVLMNAWGRDEDIHHYTVYKRTKPLMEKYKVDFSKVLTPDFSKFKTRVSQETVDKLMGSVPANLKGVSDAFETRRL
jgi:hypothetical protein